MHSIVFSVSLSTVFVSLSPFLIFLTLIPPCHAHTNTYKIRTRTKAHTRVDEHESGCVPRSPGVCQENHICKSAALCSILFAELSVSPPTPLSFSYTMCTSIHTHIRACSPSLSLSQSLPLTHTLTRASYLQLWASHCARNSSVLHTLYVLSLIYISFYTVSNSSRTAR